MCGHIILTINVFAITVRLGVMAKIKNILITYCYDSKDQLTELIHRDKEGILDRYTYTYDLVGNKTGIRKERRGLTKESGTYTYGYDARGQVGEHQERQCIGDTVPL